MRIVLVNPAFPPSLWDLAECRDLDGGRYPHVPLALPTLAALTPREHRIRLVDENVEPVDLTMDADVVGITGYWIQRERAFELADAFRARGCVVALGGPMVEASTIDACAAHADAVFQGEAEYTWPQFLSDLAAGEAKPRYVQRTLVDMADSPPPRVELLKRGAYRSAPVETSRGCPYRCEFCEVPTRLGQRSRTKSVDQVLREVRAHYALGARTVAFVDDHMLGHRKRGRELLTALADFNASVDHAISFTCQFTINLAKDEELLELLWRANFRRVFVGIETPHREALEVAGKRQNLVVDMADAVRRLHAYDIVVWAGMIVGFDADDAGTFEAQRDFLERAGVPVAMIGLLQAIPGTPLYARMLRAGRLREESMAGVRGPYDGLVRSNIVPVSMSDAELVRGYQRLVREVYEPEAFGERLLSALTSGTRPLRGSGRAPLSDLLVAGRVGRWYLLGDRRRRRLFLRVVGEVLRRRPGALASALMHLVVYKHLHHFYARISALPVPEPAPVVPAPTLAPLAIGPVP